MLYAQFNETEFFNRVKTIYHSLRLTGLNNFSSWVTSNVFREQTKEFYEQEVFPLEIIWKNPDQMYYIKRPLPDIKDIEKHKNIEQLQMDMLVDMGWDGWQLLEVSDSVGDRLAALIEQREIWQQLLIRSLARS